MLVAGGEEGESVVVCDNLDIFVDAANQLSISFTFYMHSTEHSCKSRILLDDLVRMNMDGAQCRAEGTADWACDERRGLIKSVSNQEKRERRGKAGWKGLDMWRECV